jgi:hypothetical protein
MDEVIAATAYLDLFLRTVYEPVLLKVFLKFILCAKIDEMSLLDTLIQRINSTTKVRRRKKISFEKYEFELSF